MRVLLIATALLALAACHKPQQQPTSNESAALAPEGPQKGVDRSHKGTSFPNVKIGDPDGSETTYEGFQGLPTLMNFWASWCAPCIRELPTLQKLADQHKSDLWVVPVNQDSGSLTSVEAFLKKTGAGKLGAYNDPKMKVAGALGVEVLPTTILYDANGKEVWRYVGDLDWTSPEAAKLLAEGGVQKHS